MRYNRSALAYLREISSVETFGALPRLGIHAPQFQPPHQRLQALLERVDKVIRLRQKVNLDRAQTRRWE